MDQQLYDCLAGSLAGDASVRTQAEQGLQGLLAQPAAGVSLARLATAREVDVSILHSACIILQRFVKMYWSAIFTQFVGPMLEEGIKEEIRQVLLNDLADPERKIRTAVAFAISTIAQSDWPLSFPALLPTLSQLLSSGDTSGVHGAMRVLAELLRHDDLAEEQMMGLIRGMMPVLLGVVRNTANPALSRAQAIAILRQAVKTLYMVKEQYPAEVEAAVAEMLPPWIEALAELLRGDVASELVGTWDGLKIREEVYKTLTTLHNSFPRTLVLALPFLLSNSTSTLAALYPAFHAHYLSSADDAPEPPVDRASAGSDTNDVGVPELACAMVDYLTGAVRSRPAKEVLVRGASVGGSKGKGKAKASREAPTDQLVGLVEVLVKYTQMTREDEENWSSDPNAFVADEDDEAEAYSLRTTSHDLLGSLLDRYAVPTAAALQQSVSAGLAISSQLRDQGDGNWWKQLEGVLAAVGSVADDLQGLLEDERDEGLPPSFDLQSLFDNVVPQLLSMTERPFLQGRAFVFASQYVNSLQGDMSRQYLEAAVHVLESQDTGVPVKVSAVKTVRNFCRYIPAEILRPYSLRVISDLVPFLQQATEETLALILEAIRAVIGVDGGVMNGQVTAQLAEVVFDVWFKNSQDPLLSAIVQETYETIAGIVSEQDDVYNALVQHAVPKLAHAITMPLSEENLSLPSAAFELTESIVRGRKGSLGDDLGPLLWPAAFERLLTTDDMESMQYGCVCLTFFVRKDCQRLMQWRATDGQSGLDKTLALLARLLNPSFSESGGLFMGDLIIHLLRNAGDHINAVLPQLLNALVQRMTVAKTSTYVSTLVLPFAYLFVMHRDATLKLLQEMQLPSTAGPSGTQTGLEVVLRAWCDDAIDTVQGSWSIKVNNLAMLELFTAQVPVLQQVQVHGDMIINDSNRNVIMTRSRTRSHPHEFKHIPFTTRALKYMLNEVQNADKAAAEAAATGSDNIEEDDGDDEWSDDDPLMDDRAELAMLSDLLGGGMAGWKDDDDVEAEEDEDLANDPIAQIDVQSRMLSTIRQAYQQDMNGMHAAVGELTDVEKAILQRTLTI